MIGDKPLSALTHTSADNLCSRRNFTSSHHHYLMISWQPQRLTDARVFWLASCKHSLYHGVGNAVIVVLFCDLAKCLPSLF